MKNIFLFFFLAITIISCDNENLSNTAIIEEELNEDLTIQNGILKFKNFNTIDSTLNLLSKMDKNTYSLWLEEYNFESASMYADKIYLEYDVSVENDSLWSIFKEKYNGVIKIDESNSNRIIELPFQREIWSPILNKEGLVIIGNTLVAFHDGRAISIFDGDISKLKYAKSLKHNKPEEGIFIGKIDPEKNGMQTRGQVLGTNTTNLIDWWYTDGSRGLDSKLEIRIIAAELDPYPGQINPPKIVGYYTNYFLWQAGLKKKIFGGYRNYNTKLGVRNIEIKGSTPLGSFQAYFSSEKKTINDEKYAYFDLIHFKKQYNQTNLSVDYSDATTISNFHVSFEQWTRGIGDWYMQDNTGKNYSYPSSWGHNHGYNSTNADQMICGYIYWRDVIDNNYLY